MADLRKHSSTSNLIRFSLRHATSGIGLTGLSSASSGLIISTIADNEATATIYTVAASNVETITTLGTFAAPTASKCRFKEVDATNHKGIYEFQFADARFSVANAKRLIISVTGATNLLDTEYEIQITQLDPYDAVRAGLTALPNVAAGANGGLPLAVDASGRVDVLKINGTSQTARDIGASVLLSSGTGTGQVTLTSGRVNADLTHIAAAAVSTSTAQLGVNAVQAGGTAWGSGAITAASIASDAITDAKVASDVTIASVTGAVGSVTGNVGGNVAGSVASVTAGVTLAAAAVQAIWDALTSALTTTGSIGKWILDKLDVVVSTRLATSGYTAPLDAAGVRTAVGLASANLDTQLADLPTAAENADAVWDEAIAGHAGAGSTGLALAGATAPSAAAVADAVWDEAMADHLTGGTTGASLNGAGSAGDPWTTPLPGAYGAGTAGKLVGDNINATISSRASQASVDTVDDFLDTEVAAIKAKTDALPADPADASDIAASFTTVNTKLDTIDDFLDTEAAAIKAQTDKLTFDGSNRVATNVTAMAADSVTASALAADAVTEIQAGLSTINAAGIRTAVGLASADLDTQIATLAVPGSAMALTSGERNSTADAILARALAAETYPATGAVPTFSQAIYMLLSELGQFSITGTTLTCKKLDGTTTSMTFTLDSASAPTSRVRAT